MRNNTSLFLPSKSHNATDVLKLHCIYGYKVESHLSVDRDSSRLSVAGLIVAIMMVLLFPPRLSFRSQVSTESR